VVKLLKKQIVKLYVGEVREEVTAEEAFVSFGIVESKNSNSWEWFLHGLKTAIGEPEGLVFSSKRHKDLDEAVQGVYPRIEHTECMRHLYSNFLEIANRDNLWATARACTPTVYEASIAKGFGQDEALWSDKFSAKLVGPHSRFE
ncbi:hypothetical protein ACMD2_27008, partial [Ananas comosus]